MVVQARMSSRRLPGKVLRDLAGRPLLGWLVARLERADAIDELVVATSIEPSDDPVAAWCSAEGVACHRGPLEDVAGRMVAAARAFGLDVLARVSGDSPLLDPGLVDLAIGVWRREQPDLVTNVWPRTFPKGQSVEVFATERLASVHASMTEPGHHEHVTRWFYDHAETLRIVNIRHDPPVGGVDLCIDEPADVGRIEELMARLGHDVLDAGVEQILVATSRQAS